jgi:DNA invertase Pin-like site-specific DNA recombinase
MPAYAYLRKSVVRQDDPKNSAEAQEAAVRAMAERYGDGKGLRILSDWDKSGRLGRAGRPGYDTLWRAIEDGTCTALYSYSMSRLARSVLELLRLFEACTERHIPIRLESDVIDTSTASGRMVAGILANVAAFEADVAGERLRAALAAKAARGERIGTVPFYGDRAGEDPAAVLSAFREAGSYSGAAKLLNERGVHTRSTNGRRADARRVWWPSSVQVIIRRLDPSVLPMRPTKGAAAGGSDFMLARLLRCPTCGTLLTGTRDRLTGPNRGRVRYSCRLGTVTPHPRISVTESHILPAIQAEVAHLRTPRQVERVTGDATKRAQLDSRRARVLDMYEAGLIDRGDRDRRLQVVMDGLVQLDARRMVSAVPTVDWTWEPKPLNAVLRALFEQIELEPGTFQPLPDGYLWTVPEWRS